MTWNPYTRTQTVNSRSVGVGKGGVSPIITSSANQSVAENSAVSISLTANQVVTWSIVGGADAALFDISGQTIEGGSFDFESPVDAGGDNVYNFIVRATNSQGRYSDQAMTLTVTDVVEIGNVFNPATLTGGGYGGMSNDGTFLSWSASTPYDGFHSTPSAALVVAKYYEWTYTISGLVAGTQYRPALLGGTNRFGTVRSANGTYAERLLVNSGNNQLEMLSLGDPGPNTMKIAIATQTLIGPYNTITVGGA